MSKFSIKKTEFKMSEDDVLQSLLGYLQHYSIDFDETAKTIVKSGQNRGLTADQIADQMGTDVVTYLRKGLISIESNDSGTPIITQHLSTPSGEHKEITYKPFSGEHKKGFPESKDIEKRQILVASHMTNAIGKRCIDTSRGEDLKVAMTIGSLFLVS